MSMNLSYIMFLNPFLFLSGLNSGLSDRSVLHHFEIGAWGFWFFVLFFTILLLIILLLLLTERIREVGRYLFKRKDDSVKPYSKNCLRELNQEQIERVLQWKKRQGNYKPMLCLLIFGLAMDPYRVIAQGGSVDIHADNLWTKAGIIITLVLLVIPVVLAIIFLFVRISRRLRVLNKEVQEGEARNIAHILADTPLEEMEEDLISQQRAKTYRLSPNMLSGEQSPKDERGLIQLKEET